MKTIVLYAFAFVVLANGVSVQSIDEVNPYEHLLRVRSASSQRVCEPGSRKTDDCENTCVCLIDGSGWGCTQRGCFHTKIDIIHEETTPMPVTEHPLQPSLKICEPGSTRVDNCITCVCNDDGSLWDCTQLDCNHDAYITMNPNITPTPDAENPSQPSLKICEPGSTKKVDCNTCFCVSDGSKWGCTRKGCSYEEISIINPDITPTEVGMHAE